ncbi:MutS-related protein [Clostridium sp. JS66]|uniref:MutS-related protein n=1 Tax=Clostridium sp. JS66 TaxID=3064705 RepID=UPI00298DB050|nr:DNA mismatch repair protein MutS [Clostridium sp. JS66]WPC44832.1 DNA mismatch repair protein MutS [Clostridium sp. JS66]
MMVAVVGYILIIVVLTTGISLGLNAERNGKLKERIESCWGKDADEKLRSDDLKTIAEYFNNRKQDEKRAFFIDEITWNDLSMDSIFKKVNTTESSPGEQYLYNILREPLYDEEKLKYRDKLIKFFQTHEKERKKIQYILAKLGKKRNCFISDYFYNPEGEKKKSNLNFYRALAIVPIVGICIAFLSPYIGLFIVSIACVINALVYYIDQNNIKYKIESFKYIVQIVKTADLILKENLEELEICNKKLKEAITLIKSIKNASFTLGNNGTDVGVMNEYISIIFLLDLINYEKISNTLIEKSEEFKIIFEAVGIIDSSISIASYRERLEGYVTPELVKCLSKQDAAIIFKDINHPLMKEQVSNSMKVSDSILITGSNASGKSTFLKTVAINIILAQTIYTCLAKEFKCCYFKIYTSMALKDDIFNNESYYIAETKSLKRIIDALNCDIPTICFIDEILRGTNTVERISASSQVLKYLTLNNCICVAATHDVELTYILERYFSNYHFEEKIIDNQITFDYLVHQGRSNTQNAIKLLGILGYSDVIVKKAEEKAYKFLKDGVWEAE